MTLEPIPDNWFARIRSLRKRMGLSQTEFARRLGVSFTTVNRWENAHHKPTRIVWDCFLKCEKEVDMNLMMEVRKPAFFSADYKRMLEYNWQILLINTRNLAPDLVGQLELSYGRPSRKEVKP